MNDGRESQVIDTFLALTDTLVSDFDSLEFLTMLGGRSVDLLDVSAAGVILRDATGRLSVAAASSERGRLLEVFAVAIDAGPCIDCVRSGEAVVSGDLTEDASARRWPRFTAGAAEAGFRAVHALPMRLRGEVIGVLTLLHTEPRILTPHDERLGQALADAATIGLLHERAVRQAETVSEQLQGALDSRVVIEQAKGVLAHQAGLSPEQAFTLLRSHARGQGLRLTVLARGVVDRTVDLRDVAGPHPPGRTGATDVSENPARP